MPVSTISPKRLEELAKSGAIDLIDVRTPAEFDEVHVAFARNVPLDRLDPKSVIASRIGMAGDPVYVICRSGSRGQKACAQFVDSGVAVVVNVEGGTQACVEAGLAVVRGRKAMSLERQVRIGAGLLVLFSVSLGWLIHEAFLGIAGFVGTGLVFAGVTDWCGMGLLLARMPWNQRGASTRVCGACDFRSVRMFRTPMSRLRTIAFVEGWSYLVLLGIAMPLKYFANQPMAVTIVGGAHGALFILLALAELHVAILRRSVLHFLKMFVASILPFGTFVIDRSLRSEEKEMELQSASETVA